MIGIAVLSVSAGLVIWASIVEPGFRYAATFILSSVAGAVLLLKGLRG